MNIHWWTCFFGHRWTPWKAGTVPTIRVIKGQRYDSFDEFQARECQACGYQQREILL